VTAGSLFATSSIANASGFLAVLWLDARNDRSSIKPPASATSHGKAVLPTRYCSDHLPTERTSSTPVGNYRRAPSGSIRVDPPITDSLSGAQLMNQKPILLPTRLRRPPKTGWSWVDRRFVREHMAYLSRDAVLLYFFLCAVADRQGVSFYSDGTLIIQLGMPHPALLEARHELLARDLIAHETRWTQVLSLQPCGQHRRPESSQGLMALGDILRQAITSAPSNQQGAAP
jgi:hypothetical protein